MKQEMLELQVRSESYQDIIKRAIQDGAESPDELDRSEHRAVAAAMIRSRHADDGTGRDLVSQNPRYERALDLLADVLESPCDNPVSSALCLVRALTDGAEQMVLSIIRAEWDALVADAAQEQAEDAINQASDRAYSERRDKTFAEGV